MNAAWRAQAILSNPSAEWTKIENESGDAAYLLTGYVALLAIVPAVSGFIGACFVGAAVPGNGIVRAPLLEGFFGAVFGYVATCATVLVLGFLIDFFAPMFGARRDFGSAFKLAVYSYTPVWLAGVFLLAPGLRFLILTAFYGVFIAVAGIAAADANAARECARLRGGDCRRRLRGHASRRRRAARAVRPRRVLNQPHGAISTCRQAAGKLAIVGPGLGFGGSVGGAGYLTPGKNQ